LNGEGDVILEFSIDCNVISYSDLSLFKVSNIHSIKADLFLNEDLILWSEHMCLSSITVLDFKNSLVKSTSFDTDVSSWSCGWRGGFPIKFLVCDQWLDPFST